MKSLVKGILILQVLLLAVHFSSNVNAYGKGGGKKGGKTETVRDYEGSFKAGYKGYGGGYGFATPKYINYKYCHLYGIKVTWLHPKFRSIKITSPISGKPVKEYPILYDGPLEVGKVLKMGRDIRRNIAYWGYTPGGGVNPAVKWVTLYECPVKK